MGLRIVLPALGALLLLGTFSVAAAPQSWEFRDGRWEQVTGSVADAAPVNDPVLDRVEEMIRRGQARQARKTLVNWLRANPQSPVRDRALFLMAEALYLYGDRIRAFYYLDELMDTYPASPYFYGSLQKQYDIADAFLNGYRRRVLGVPLLDSSPEAVEMLYRIQQRSPGSPLADKALLRTADHYYANAEYDLAGDAYAAYARSYPRSPVIARVRLRQAFSSYAQFRGLRFDPTPIVDAREQLRSIEAQYPQLAKEENLDQVLEQIDQTLAGKMYTTANFYRRTNEPVAAAFTLQRLIAVYPDTEPAERAEKDLRTLPQWAIDRAARPLAAPPTTAPSLLQ